jgi:hypothetical protein
MTAPRTGQLWAAWTAAGRAAPLAAWTDARSVVRKAVSSAVPKGAWLADPTAPMTAVRTEQLWAERWAAGRDAPLAAWTDDPMVVLKAVSLAVPSGAWLADRKVSMMAAPWDQLWAAHSVALTAYRWAALTEHLTGAARVGKSAV